MKQWPSKKQRFSAALNDPNYKISVTRSLFSLSTMGEVPLGAASAES